MALSTKQPPGFHPLEDDSEEALQEQEIAYLSKQLDQAADRLDARMGETMREIKESSERIQAILAYADHFRP